MAKRKTQQESPRAAMSGADRLGLRVSMMINSPKAQLSRCVTVHQLDTDTDEDWLAVIDLVRETDGTTVADNEDGSVTVSWDAPSEEDARVEDGAMQPTADEIPF